MTESPYTNPETQCISQQNAALLLSDNDNLCQSLDANRVWGGGLLALWCWWRSSSGGFCIDKDGS